MWKIVEKKGDEVHINIFLKQADFINSKCDEVLFGGSAGPGKSCGLLLFALKRRLEIPKSSGVIFRRSFPELETSIIRKSFEIYPHFGATYNVAKHIWTFPNGSIQEFKFCLAEKDVYLQQGNEWDDICFDESSHFTEFQITYLTSRLRTTKTGVKPLIRLASNPGGVGHNYMKSRYVDPSVSQKIWTDPYTGNTISFIPAFLKDNPALEEADPNYVNRLKALPYKKYLALAEGRWDVWEGQFFEGFDSRPGVAHVLAMPRTPNTESRKIMSMDWGFSDPACVHWIEITPMGRIFFYRELYVTQKSPKELAHMILDMTPEIEKMDYMATPTEIFGKKVETEGGGEPIQQLMESVLGDRIPMIRANNARIPGWTKMREFLMMAPDGFPWMQISPSCQNLIRTIPAMVYDEHRAEDLDDSGESHAVDSARYGLVSIHDIPKSLLTPYESGYHKIFGIKSDGQKMYSDLPKTSTLHGGY